jgi:hypothetical protein
VGWSALKYIVIACVQCSVALFYLRIGTEVLPAIKLHTGSLSLLLPVRKQCFMERVGGSRREMVVKQLWL